MGRSKTIEHDKATLRKLNDSTLRSICDAMSGVEWDSQVGNQIADILHAAGYEISEPDPARLPPACCPKCGKREDLYVTETYIAFHPYDAQRHSAACDMPDARDGEADHAGYCGSCGHKGTLEEFAMKLLVWDDEDEDEDEDEEGEDVEED